jgi:hypothetical protein
VASNRIGTDQSSVEIVILTAPPYVRLRQSRSNDLRGTAEKAWRAIGARV